MGLLEQTTKKATEKNPREIIIFSYPKIGKTEAFTKLPGKYLILDFEKGTDFYDCNAINVQNLDIFDKIKQELIEKTKDKTEKEKRNLYDFIVLDTLTSLYDNIINSISVRLYNTESKEKRPLSWSIDKLDFGKGHIYKREATKKVIEFLKSFCKCLIIAGHVKPQSGDGDNKSGVNDLDIEGKIKNILAFKTDAIGLLYRNVENQNQNILSFAGQMGGTRTQHLTNKEIILSEKQEDGSLKTNWDQVFI